jgi:hypothetical protein
LLRDLAVPIGFREVNFPSNVAHLSFWSSVSV